MLHDFNATTVESRYNVLPEDAGFSTL